MPARTAQSFLDKYWDKTLPVDPIAIAKAAGIEVRPSYDLGDGISGSFEYEDGAEGQHPVITYNLNDSILRQRFTVAHELGHFAFGDADHGKVFRDGSKNFNIDNYDPVEVRANQFASQLLMPTDVVNGLIEKRNITSPSELAAKFKVSGLAMHYRLKSMGWLSGY